ncbi:MAG: Periplasmic protein CpxP [Candidatus Erwinia impunctatus]
MRKIITVAVLPALVFIVSVVHSTASIATDMIARDSTMLQSMAHIPQLHMFDGITLTELQRQQLRDLMQQTRRVAPAINVEDAEKLHMLIIADNFDKAAYRKILDRIAATELNQQVEMAHVRNQMYQLLTPAQQQLLNNNHQRRMDTLRAIQQKQSSPFLSERRQLVTEAGAHE